MSDYELCKAIVGGITSTLDYHHAEVALSAIADEMTYVVDFSLATFVQAVRDKGMTKLADTLTEQLLGDDDQ